MKNSLLEQNPPSVVRLQPARDAPGLGNALWSAERLQHFSCALADNWLSVTTVWLLDGTEEVYILGGGTMYFSARGFII